jgi:protein-disulfide isomerase
MHEEDDVTKELDQRAMQHGAVMCLIVALGAGLALSGCSKKDQPSESEPKAEAPKPADAAQGGAAKPDAPKDDKADAVKIVPEDIYPNFNFKLLSPEERQKFVQIAEAELCPCPESTTSLHVCLQKMETRCGVAEQAAVTIAYGIKEKVSATDIQDRVAKMVDSYKKIHEFELKDTPFKGNADSNIVFVEFADFECPHCRMASMEFKKLAEKQGDTFKLYYKQFPLNSHPNAEVAARAALAAHKQGKFWPMHDLIFENQSALSPDKFEKFAQQIGLNIAKFKADMESPEIKAQVARDRAEGEKAEISGTPAIFLNGRKYIGDGSVEGLAKAIEAEKAARAVDKK